MPVLDKQQAAMTMGAIATEGRSKLQRARVWLVMRLLEGPELATDVLDDGEDAGFNQTVIRRASKGLILKRHERTFGGPWVWELQPRLDTVGINDYKEALIKKLLEATQ